MTKDITQQGVLFKDWFDRPLHVQFDQPDSSSDSGAFLLTAVGQELGLTERLAQCLRNNRDPGSVVHSYLDTLRQRVFGLCCGYEDCNDAARLKADSVYRMLLGRDPQEGDELASQPTLSRFKKAIEGGIKKRGVLLTRSVAVRNLQNDDQLPAGSSAQHLYHQDCSARRQPHDLAPTENLRLHVAGSMPSRYSNCHGLG